MGLSQFYSQYVNTLHFILTYYLLKKDISYDFPFTKKQREIFLKNNYNELFYLYEKKRIIESNLKESFRFNANDKKKNYFN